VAEKEESEAGGGRGGVWLKWLEVLVGFVMWLTLILALLYLGANIGIWVAAGFVLMTNYGN
jgi:uncharacterized protein involved in cysteine biosynthesis